MKIIKSKVKLPSSNYTLNTYIGKKIGKDYRFLNKNYREGYIDRVTKILYIPKGEKVEFQIKGKLDHIFDYKVVSPLNANSKMQNLFKLYLNDERLETLKLNSEKEKNILTIESISDSLELTGVNLLPNKKQSAPDVLFIVIDSLRADVLGSYGASFGATPELDEFAKTSIVFKHHLVNSSWTRPSTMIFFTGKYASETYINFWDYPIFKEEKNAFYRSSLFPLPAYLSVNSFHSVMIGNNPFFNDSRYIGIDTGFEEMSDFSIIEKDTPYISDKILKYIYNLPVKEQRRPEFIFLNYNDSHFIQRIRTKSF